jgi:membrane protein
MWPVAAHDRGVADVSTPRNWLRRGWTVGRRAVAVVERWASDRCSTMSAALAFYAAFSLAPMLVVVIAVASLFFGAEAVQGRLYGNIAALMGPQGASIVQAMVASASKSGHGGLSGILSLGATILGASATFAELSGALDRIWRARPPAVAVAALIRVRLTSFGLVVGVGFLIVVLLIADAAITFATEVLIGGGFLDPLVGRIEHVISFIFLWWAFAVLLKVLPNTAVRWREAAVGGLTAALLFTVGKRLFAFYLAHAGTANAFGAASSLAILMMWLYFSAAVFLLAAELAAVLAHRDEAGQGARGQRSTALAALERPPGRP